MIGQVTPRIALALVTLCCNESRTTSTATSSIDPHVGREVPLEYKKVTNQPKLADLRGDGADDARVRIRWAEAMSRLGSIATLRAENETLVVAYAGTVHGRICVASEWATLHDLPALGFSLVRCTSGGEAPVPSDGGLAKRRRLVERAHDVVSKLDAGLVWHEGEGLVLTAIVEQGRCSRGVLAKLVAAIKKASIDLKSEGFERIACSVDGATLAL